MSAPRPWIVGNWKMNGLGANIAEACKIAQALTANPTPVRAAICAPATLVYRLAQAVQGSNLIIGGEDLHLNDHGPHTGDISAEMLADAGARMVIVGHSERRAAYGETDALVSRKALAAARAGLTPIICVGETQAQRAAGQTLEVVRRQVAGSAPKDLAGVAFIVAYEPIWAIGSGRTPGLDEIGEALGAVRGAIVGVIGTGGDAVPILYGGSVDPSNAAGVFKAPHVSGALVGGASLTAEAFLQILYAADAGLARADRPMAR
jgi:triosephosphate isomerase